MSNNKVIHFQHLTSGYSRGKECKKPEKRQNRLRKNTANTITQIAHNKHNQTRKKDEKHTPKNTGQKGKLLLCYSTGASRSLLAKHSTRTISAYTPATIHKRVCCRFPWETKNTHPGV